MRGELDDALAKMARLEELRRRRAAEPDGTGPDRDPTVAVVEAVRRVVAQYPGLSVTLAVDDGGTVRPLRVAWAGDAVTVDGAAPRPATGPAAAPAKGTAPPPWPLPMAHAPGGRTTMPEPDDDPAARLAELIRRNPSLLDRIGRKE